MVLVGASSILPSSSSAQESSTPDLLYVIDSDAASLEKDDDRYSVVMRGTDRKAEWFQDRPGTQSGLISVRRVLASFFEKEPVVPPNGVLDGWHEGRRMRIPVKVRSGNYGDRKLRLRVSVLDGFNEKVPPKLNHAALFLDNGPFYHTCDGELNNRTQYDFDLFQANKWDSDTWTVEAPASMPAGASVWWWSEGGQFRGCGNEVEYLTSDGSVGVVAGMTDPWSSGNTWGCETFGDPGIQCYGPLTLCSTNDGGEETCSNGTTGSDMDVLWYVCDTNDTICTEET